MDFVATFDSVSQLADKTSLHQSYFIESCIFSSIFLENPPTAWMRVLMGIIVVAAAVI
jgi:hypothetical protein